MKKFLIALLAILIAMPATVGLAKEKKTIEILNENGIIKGDGESLNPDRYMTCGEFATAAARMYADNYDEIEESVANWKTATMLCAVGFCSNKELYDKLEENFDAPITPEFAQEIMMGMLDPDYQNGTYISYFYWIETGKEICFSFNGPDELGYDTSIIPDVEYITREQASKMLCELLYLEYPIVGDYIPVLYIGQYTLKGKMIIHKVANDEVSADIFNKRPKRNADKKQELPDDIRNKSFLEENIVEGMEHKTVEGIIGSAYKCVSGYEFYYYYMPNTDSYEHGYMKIEYVDEKVSKICFEAADPF